MKQSGKLILGYPSKWVLILKGFSYIISKSFLAVMIGSIGSDWVRLGQIGPSVNKIAYPSIEIGPDWVNLG